MERSRWHGEGTLGFIQALLSSAIAVWVVLEGLDGKRGVHSMSGGSEGCPHCPTASSTAEGGASLAWLWWWCYPQHSHPCYRASFLAATVFTTVAFKPASSGTDVRLLTHCQLLRQVEEDSSDSHQQRSGENC